MMKRKELANMIKFLGILCVFVLGYFTIVGTGSDVEDIVGDVIGPQTTDETLELQEVTLEKSSEAQLLTVTDPCPTTTIQTELNKIDGAEDWLDYITEINVIDLAVSVTVSGVTITALEGSTMNCSLTIEGSGVSQFAGSEIYSLVEDYPISGEIGPITIYASGTTAFSIIDWYLNEGRNSSFEYCVECTGDDDFSDYQVTFAPLADIEVTFEL